MNSKLSLRNKGKLLLQILFIMLITLNTSCIQSPEEGPPTIDEPGTGTDPGGEEPDKEMIEISTDLPYYYPGDNVILMFPSTVVLSYQGILQNMEMPEQEFPFEAHRVEGETENPQLAFTLPIIPPYTNYNLRITIKDTIAATTLHLLGWAPVSDPQALINDLTSNIGQSLEQLEAKILISGGTLDAGNRELVQDMVELFNETMAQMSEEEKYQFAAYWNSIPQLQNLFNSPAAALRSTEGENFDDIISGRSLTTDRLFLQDEIGLALGLGVAILGVKYAPGLVFKAVCAAIGVFAVCKYLDVFSTIKEQYRKTNIPDFREIITKKVIGDFQFAPPLRSNMDNYDYIFSPYNPVKSFDLELFITSRSLCAEDINSSISDVREIIRLCEKFRESWNETVETLDKVCEFLEIEGRLLGKLESVADITTFRESEEFPVPQDYWYNLSIETSDKNAYFRETIKESAISLSHIETWSNYYASYKDVPSSVEFTFRIKMRNNYKGNDIYSSEFKALCINRPLEIHPITSARVISNTTISCNVHIEKHDVAPLFQYNQ